MDCDKTTKNTETVFSKKLDDLLTDVIIYPDIAGSLRLQNSLPGKKRFSSTKLSMVHCFKAQVYAMTMTTAKGATADTK